MSELTSLVSTVAKYAPLVANCLPIPGAGAIVQLIASAFGGTPTDTTNLANLIQKDPDAAVKLKEIEINSQVQLQQLLVNKAISDAQIAAADRADARKMQETNKSYMPSFLSMMILIGFFIILFCLAKYVIPADNANIVYMLVGGINSSLGAVIAYWLGTTSSSKDKDAMLYNSTPLGAK